MQENKKIVFIIPYFGKIPEYFDLWRKTALSNSKFDFLFITDIQEITEHKNIKVMSMTFGELQKKVQSRFEFPISLEEPYKLCDYKPAYGYIFEQEIEAYDFWGHCDIDMLLGNLEKFITSNILETYDKIYEHGHMTLYRNNKECNRMFMNNGDYPEYNFQEVYQSKESYYYDEYYGMMLKERRLNVNTYLNTKEFFDVRTNSLEFVDAHEDDYIDMYFELYQGSLIARKRDGSYFQEVAYAHFQKRKMNYTKINGIDDIFNTHIYIYPNIADTTFNATKISVWKSKGYKLRAKYLHMKDFYKRYQLVKDEYGSIRSYYESRQKFKERRGIANILLKGESSGSMDTK